MLPPLIAHLTADITQFVAGMDAAKAKTVESTEESSAAASGLANIGRLALVGLAVGMAAAGVEAVHMAGDFQASQTRLVTGAGESVQNLQMVSSGLLDMAGQVGVSAQQLSQGMYLVESAGFHAGAGLQVMRAAAEGARADGADMTTMANALTTALNAYNTPASQATNVTNQMVAAVAAGKMNMEDFAGSLSAVLPIAAAAGVNFAQVAGAEATMTAQGMSAQQASQDLANTIRSLQAPNQVAVKEMQQLGLSSNDVALSLGKKGLTGTLDELTTAITSQMGPSGEVLLNSFKASKQAAADAQVEINAMPASLQKLASAYLDGSVTEKQWATDMKALPPLQANIMKEFANTANQTHAFNDQLRSGSPAAQTYNAALEKMLGGSTGLNTALMLTGGHMATFKANVDSVAEAGKKGGQNIADWGEIQKTFNFQMDSAKASLGAAGIALGTGLLPAVTKLLTVITPVISAMADWMAHNQTATAIIFAVVAAVTVLLVVFMAIAVIAPLVAAAGAIIGTGLTLMLGPIGLIILAVVAVIAIVVLLITHWKQVEAAAGAVGAAIGRAFSGLGSMVHNALSAVGNAIGSFFSDLGAKAHGLVSAVGGAFSALGSAVSGALGRLVAIGESAWSQFTQRPLYWIAYLAVFIPLKLLMLEAQFGAWIGGMIAKAAEWAAGMIEQAVVAGTEFVANAIALLARLPGKAEALLTDVITRVDTWAAGMVARAISAAQNFVSNVVSELQQLPGQVESWLSNVISRAEAFASQLPQQATTAAQGFANNLRSILNALPGEMAGIGAAIIQGLANGISSAVGAAKAAASQAVSGILDAAKAAAGISSPSRLFADAVGLPISQGIAQGIQQGSPVVHGAVTGVVTSAASPTSLAPAPAAVPGGGYQINFYIYGAKDPGGTAAAIDQRLSKYLTST